VDSLWGTGWLWFGLFIVAMLVNARAAFKLLVDWRGMLTTCRFVTDAYARLDALPTEAALERTPGIPIFLHLVVATKASEEAGPHPAMPASTAELARRFRETLPPWQQKMLSVVAMPGSGRKAHQLNWALRPETLGVTLGEGYDPRRVYVGVSDADSLPDRNVYRWMAAEVLAGRGAPAYQGVTLSLANFVAQDGRGRVCAIQQSSIFIRVSIARLINEARRLRWFARLTVRAPRVGRAIRPVFEFCFRRSQICLGHNQFVRLDVLQAIGGFPTSGATEDSTLGLAIGARGLLMAPMPMLELVDLPETKEKMIRQNARWYKGVLDDVPFLWRVWRAAPTAFNAAQLCRHVGNKVVEWPIAALIYPLLGFLGWHLAYRFADHPVLFALGIACPSISLGLSIWVGGIVTQDCIEDVARHLERPLDVRRTTLRQRLVGTFRCQTYWLLATRGAWRVLWMLARQRRFDPPKTDRVTR